MFLNKFHKFFKRMEYSTAMKKLFKYINKAQIQNVEHKEPSTKVCILYNFIYSKFQN